MTASSKFVIFISVFLVVLILSVAITFILPEKFFSTCRIKDEMGTRLTDPGQNGAVYTPFFTRSLFKIIPSPAVLTNVVANLDLNHRWGVKYNAGRGLQTSESLARLRHDLVLTAEPSRQLIDITVYSENKNEAAEIANAIAEAYQDYWSHLQKEEARQSLKNLQKLVAESEVKIQAATTNLEYLRRKFRIMENDNNTQSFSAIQDLRHQMDQAYGKQLAESEKVCKQLAAQLAELKSLDTNKLRMVLPSVTGDTILSNLIANLEAAKHASATTTNNGARIQELNHEIGDRIEGIMLGLESEVASKNHAFKVISEAIQQARKNDQEEAERTQPYWKEMRNLECLIKFHNLLTTKAAAEKSELETPKTAWVAIVEPAVPGEAPVTPNKPLCVATGGIAGLLLAWLATLRRGNVTVRTMAR